MEVCEQIEGGATLSEGMGKCPKVFNRLYVNMIKAGEAGGALEIILRRLSDFMERAESLKRKVKGAMIYPCVVVAVAIAILAFIMIKIVPVFQQMFEDFDLKLPAATDLLIQMSKFCVQFWYMIPLIPLAVWVGVMVIRKFKAGRMGWDMFILKVPIFGNLIEKNILARTTRTLGTLVASGVPILEGLTITRETAGNGMFERLFVGLGIYLWGGYAMLIGTVVATLYYLLKMTQPVVDLLVVNMVDVGEETGELDTMLYKVADTYDEEVKTLTDGLMALIEPLLICFLGVAVGFIVISLFMPLVGLIQGLS